MKFQGKWTMGCLLLAGLGAMAQSPQPKNKTIQKPAAAAYTAVARPSILAPAPLDTAYFVLARKRSLDSVLRLPQPVKTLQHLALPRAAEAQALALADPYFTKYFFETATRKPLLSEVFSVYPARPGDLRPGMVSLQGNLWRVEMYNYALNLSTIAIVDVFQQKVLSVDHFPQAQADIPNDLKNLAIQIATEHPEVEKALGFKPSAKMPLMSNTKTALNRTRCERSQHLCVAPTFVQGNRALWAIVDLTDLRLVGLRWTDLGKDGEQQVATERRLQNENTADCFCEKVNHLDQMGWQMDYVITSSDGLQITGVRFQNQPVLRSAKLVDWHVNYSGTDGFGYSDAVGCPIFSQAAVVATDPPVMADMVEGDSTVGFMLEQLFFSELWPTPCNYSYSQRYYFYKDGRFRVSAASIGRGCGNNGTYRPVFRLAFAGEEQRFSAKGANGLWQVWQQEKWVGPVETAAQPAQPLFRLDRKGAPAYALEPGMGQFGDGGRGDQPYVYVTLDHQDKDEGERDLVTIGPCCNTDYRQGPEKFLEPKAEAILDKPLVIWYVPQMKNDDRPGAKYCWAETYWEEGRYKVRTYPCFAGPLFVPTK